ncbi:hypothetical protein GOODEAATRI_030708 [Goodea atripinnis]|uniref:Uncharacterized protein n=1 Tax=Goodea atripinnis TaxID=208336 RepID=A0ABV0NZ09_9TELE
MVEELLLGVPRSAGGSCGPNDPSAHRLGRRRNQPLSFQPFLRPYFETAHPCPAHEDHMRGNFLPPRYDYADDSNELVIGIGLHLLFPPKTHHLILSPPVVLAYCLLCSVSVLQPSRLQSVHPVTALTPPNGAGLLIAFLLPAPWFF